MAKPLPRRPIARPGSPKKRPRKRSGGSGGLVVGLLLAAAAGGGGWWFLQKPSGTSTAPSAVKQVVSGDDEPERAPATEGSLLGGARPAPAPETGEETSKMFEPESAAKEEKPAKETADFSKPLEFDELKGAQAPAVAWRNEALEAAFRTNDWEGYRDLLGRSLTGWLETRFRAENPDTAAAVFANPLTLEALTRHALITRAEDGLSRFLKENPGAASLTKKLVQSQELSQALLTAIQPEDDFIKVMKVWADIYEEDQSAAGEWSELALAVALVFDNGLNARWGEETQRIDPYQRYSFYKSNSEAGRLTGNIRRMRAPELVWVVSAPVPQAELEWALKHANFRQRNWGQAYDFIKYDMEKAVKGKDVYDIYSFEEIKKKGGICGDRAFFSAYTARACGVPAAIIAGDGARGGHAWMTWMADEGEWQFSGRFAGYPAGGLTHPQTGRNMSEDEVVRLNDRKASDPARTLKAARYLELASLYSDTPKNRLALLTTALDAAPRFPAAGKAMLAYWTEKKGEDPVEEWTRFLADLRKDFRDHNGLMDEVKAAEEKFVFPRQDGKLAMRTMRREAKKVDDTGGAERGVAADTQRLAESFRRQAELLKTNKDMEGIRGVYRRAMADHGADPALFKALARDFYALVSEDKDTAVKACRDLENACRRYVGRGRGDFFDISSQNSAWHVVAECYTKAGDEKKASEIEKDINNRAKKAERNAL